MLVAKPGFYSLSVWLQSSSPFCSTHCQSSKSNTDFSSVTTIPPYFLMWWELKSVYIGIIPKSCYKSTCFLRGRRNVFRWLFPSQETIPWGCHLEKCRGISGSSHCVIRVLKEEEKVYLELLSQQKQFLKRA